jgi:nucleoside-diphosphate-sugar epimerase
MRAFLTGGTGFIGYQVARKLRERGDEVVALARSPEKAAPLRELGCEVVEGDLSDTDAISRGLQGADSAFHVAAVYKVGMPKSEQQAMWEANVAGTERVLDAAIEAGTGRILYVSTAYVFGNTHGEMVDEDYERDLSEGFLACYDETKFRSHQIARDRIGEGAPIVIVQPTFVYGPGQHSETAHMIDQASRGKLLMKAFPDMGFVMAHVEDVAEGILLAHDRGRVGESYILGGEKSTLGEVIDKAAQLSGRKPPRMTLPPLLAKLSAPLGPVVGPPLGFPPNLKEAIRAADGVTYWARDDKARRELGYSPRGLDEGLRQTLDAAAG